MGGVYFLSFLVVSASSAVLLWTVLKRRRAALVYVALIGLSLLYGTYRLRLWELETDHTHQVALVQPGIDLRGTRSYFRKVYFQQLPEFYARASRTGAEWVIFPEAPKSFFPAKRLAFPKVLENGCIGPGPTCGPERHGTLAGKKRVWDYNSAFLLDEAGEMVYRYDKRHLVPFGEYLPPGEYPAGAVPFSGSRGQPVFPGAISAGAGPKLATSISAF